MSTKISDLSIEEFTVLVGDIIDQRIRGLLDDDGELRELFVEELLSRKDKPELVDFDRVFVD